MHTIPNPEAVKHLRPDQLLDASGAAEIVTELVRKAFAAVDTTRRSASVTLSIKIKEDPQTEDLYAAAHVSAVWPVQTLDQHKTVLPSFAVVKVLNDIPGQTRMSLEVVEIDRRKAQDKSEGEYLFAADDEPEGSDCDGMTFGAGVPLDEVKANIERLLPDLLAHPQAKGLKEIKARILLAVYLTTRIPDEDGDLDDGSPISRAELQALIGCPPDVHPGQLARAGWIAGDNQCGYTITIKGHALCYEIGE